MSIFPYNLFETEMNLTIDKIENYDIFNITTPKTSILKKYESEINEYIIKNKINKNRFKKSFLIKLNDNFKKIEIENFCKELILRKKEILLYNNKINDYILNKNVTYNNPINIDIIYSDFEISFFFKKIYWKYLWYY